MYIDFIAGQDANTDRTLITQDTDFTKLDGIVA